MTPTSATTVRARAAASTTQNLFSAITIASTRSAAASAVPSGRTTSSSSSLMKNSATAADPRRPTGTRLPHTTSSSRGPKKASPEQSPDIPVRAWPTPPSTQHPTAPSSALSPRTATPSAYNGGTALGPRFAAQDNPRQQPTPPTSATDSPASGAALTAFPTSSVSTSSIRRTNTAQQFNGRLDWQLNPRDLVSYTIYWVPTSSTFLQRS